MLEALPHRPAIAARLSELLTTGAVGAPVVRAGRVFYQRRQGTQDQPVLVLREPHQAAERVVLDPNTLSAGGIVALDWWYPSHDGRLLAYGTSEGGTELSTLRVLNVDTGEHLPDEAIPYTRAASLAWLPDSSGFYLTRYPVPGSVPAGEEHYHRHVFFHQLGTSWQHDPCVFGQGRAREDWPSIDLSHDGRWLVVVVSQGWAKSEVYCLHRTQPERGFVAIHAGSQSWADTEFAGDQLLLRTNLNAPNYQLFAVDPQTPDRDRWRLVLPEQPERVLSGVRAIAGQLATEELYRATSHLHLYTPDGTPQGAVALPAIGSLTGLGGEWDAPSLWFGFTSFAQPPTLYRLDPPAREPTLYAAGELPPGLDTSRYEVRQEFYPSKDGTRISAFVVSKRGLVRDGNNPTLLTGYGGFNVSRTPMFVAALPLWLDAGGLYVLPNLRGGGEYGEAWHQAGMLGNKQNVFDDFIAAAEWLIADGYTRPDRLAIQGGSNGGLLVGAALVQRPDLFQAVVCQVPLLDMLRYQRLRIASLWVAEYGSADDPLQFRWLRAYSPYHHVREGTRYPAVLLLTAEGDSRVDPMHARKMAARLQAATAADAPVLLRVEPAAGHGQGKPRRKQLEEATEIWSFLFWQLRVTPPAAAA